MTSSTTTHASDASAAGPGALVRSVLRGQRRAVATGSVFVVAHQASETLVPVVIGVVIDRAVTTGDAASMARWVGLLVALFVTLGTAGLLGYYLLEKAGLWMAHDLRQRVVDRVVAPDGGVDARSGEVVSLATSDADAVGEVGFGVGLTLGAIPALVGGAAILLSTSITLGLVVLAGLPIVLAVVAVASKPLMARIEAEQAAVAGATGVATDLLRGLRVLKGIGAEATGASRYRRASRSALTARMRAARFGGAYEGLTLVVSGAFLVVVAWVGGRLALDDEITVGQLVTAVGLAQFLVAPLSMVTGIGAVVAGVRASAGRLQEVLARPAAVPDGGPGSGSSPTENGDGSSRGTLVLRGVTHGPLDGLDLDIGAGEHVAVVADPADAAALLEVLGRRRDPVLGAVILDGVAYPAWPLDVLRRRVAVVGHNAALFSGTLGENLTAAAAPGIDLDAVLAATAADEVVAAVPDGLDTVVGEGAGTLSGGQRQRVALARAVATDAEVLVLHDPTTAVDAATEHVIAGGLATLRAGRTTVVVASSPALLARCDRVVVLRHGRVAVAGTHADLVATDADYREAVLR